MKRPVRASEPYLRYLDSFAFSLDENSNDSKAITPEIFGHLHFSTINDRRMRGAVRTPKALAMHLCELALSEARVRPDDISASKNNKEKMLERVRSLTVLDPSAGAGDILVTMLDALAEVRLRLGERDAPWVMRDIVNNNLFGADLDEGALRAANMRLEMRILNSLISTGGKTRIDLVLDTLNNNLVVGSTLPGMHAIDWQSTFSFVNGGKFEVVIGNPPWGAMLEKKAYSVEKNDNSFSRFLIRALELTNDGGVQAFILPRNFLRGRAYEGIRRDILSNYRLRLVEDLGARFERVTSEAIIEVISNEKMQGKVRLIVGENARLVEQSALLAHPRAAIDLAFDESIEAMLRGMEERSRNTIRDLGICGRGIECGRTGEFAVCACGRITTVPKKKIKTKKCKCGRTIGEKNERFYAISKENDGAHTLPIISGNCIERYSITGRSYLSPDVAGLGYKRKFDFSKRKLLIPKNLNTLRAAIDDSGAYVTQTVYFIFPKEDEGTIDLLLVLLNSKPVRFYYEKRFNLQGDLTSAVVLDNLLSLPIPKIDEKVRGALVVLGKKLTELRGKNDERWRALDDAADALTFALYFHVNVHILDDALQAFVEHPLDRNELPDEMNKLIYHVQSTHAWGALEGTIRRIPRQK